MSRVFQIKFIKVALSQKILENFNVSNINIPNHYPELFTVLGGKLKIVIWNIYVWDVKIFFSIFWLKVTLTIKLHNLKIITLVGWLKKELVIFWEPPLSAGRAKNTASYCPLTLNLTENWHRTYNIGR